MLMKASQSSGWPEKDGRTVFTFDCLAVNCLRSELSPPLSARNALVKAPTNSDANGRLLESELEVVEQLGHSVRLHPSTCQPCSAQ